MRKRNYSAVASLLALDGAEYRLVWVLSFLIILAMGVYLYAVTASIVDVVVRERSITEAGSARSRIGALEAAYFASEESIDRSYAKAQGFVGISQKTFVRRQALSTVSVRE